MVQQVARTFKLTPKGDLLGDVFNACEAEKGSPLTHEERKWIHRGFEAGWERALPKGPEGAKDK